MTLGQLNELVERYEKALHITLFYSYDYKMEAPRYGKIAEYEYWKAKTSDLQEQIDKYLNSAM